jgi:hypothetical protein
MSIPLEQLYDFYDSIISDNLIIYQFWPHGSKNILDLKPIQAYSLEQVVTDPIMICHDQEPLHFDFYTSDKISGLWAHGAGSDWPPEFAEFWESRNLRSACEVNIHDQCLLLHSEQRSKNLNQYQQSGFVPVYVWSHGIIARDWYRYAEIDPRLQTQHQSTYDFNIYARAWTGTREYRLMLLALTADISHHCRVTFAANDGGSYQKYQPTNPKFYINHFDLVNLYSDSSISSDSSATYNWQHYQQCAIDVVTETLFDDDRMHLTEKVLRPIACGKPFIIAGPWGSLEYLRTYGFETFESLIDETYDTIENPYQRLRALTDLMRQIARMSGHHKKQLYHAMNNIAQRNRRHFFSTEFFQQLIVEYSVNARDGLRQVYESCQGTEWNSHMSVYNQYPNLHSEILDLQSVVLDRLHTTR